VKIHGHGDLLTIPLKINGSEYEFLVHTKQRIAYVYDQSLQPMLGEPIRTETIHFEIGDSATSVYRALNAKIGEVSIDGSECEAFCADLSDYREITGHHIQGIVGIDVLRRYIIQIDCDREELLFLSSRDGQPGEQLPLSWVNGLPALPVSLGGLTFSFTINTGDCGWTSGSLTPSVFDRLKGTHQLEYLHENSVRTGSGRDLTRSAFGRAKELSIGNSHLHNLCFSTAGDNCVGTNFWSRYRVTFDFPHDLVRLQPGKDFGIPDCENPTGLELRFIGGRIIVKTVAEGSPGSAAGFKPWDVIVNAAGKDTGKLCVYSVSKLIFSQAESVDVSVERSGILTKLKMPSTR
jgi:hypothetical protein